MVPAIAGAAEWSVQSAAQIYAQAESNPQLLADQRAAQSGVVDATLDVLRRTELLTLDLNAHASSHRYNNDAGLDRDDQQVALALSRMGETYTLQGNGSITRDTTATSELGTTGLTGFNLRHRARSLSLAPQWQLSERLTTGATLGWQDSTYAKDEATGLSDYSYLLAGLNSSYDLSETTSGTLSISAGRLNSALYTFYTDNLDVQLQLQHVWSPRWKGSIAAGPSRVRTDGRVSSGSLFSTSLTYQAERLSLDTSISRSIAPTGDGLQSRRDELEVHGYATLSEHLTANARVALIRSKDLVPSFGFTVSDVRYTRAELSLSWAFARDWNFGVTTGHSEQKSLGSSDLVGRGLDARMTLSWRHLGPLG